jgi:hypothetical protein
MEESDAYINISEKTAVSIFRVRIKNVTPCIYQMTRRENQRTVMFVKEKWVKLPVSLHRLRYSGSFSSAFRPQYTSIDRPLLKHFKERKRKEVVVVLLTLH